MKFTDLFKKVAVIAAITLSAGAYAKDMRLGLIVPASHEWTKAAEAMGEELKEKSDGKYSVTVFPAGQLGNEAQMLQQLQTGALDMAFMTVAEITNRSEDFGALFAPYLVKNVHDSGVLLNGPTAQKMLEDLPGDVGAVGLGFGGASMRLLLTNFPVDSAADLDGRKIRITPFPPAKDFYQIMGAASTPMPVTDVYDSLANGQVDGVDADLELVWRMKFYERGNTLLHSSHMMFPVVGLISNRLWMQLDDEDKELIGTAAKKHLNGLFKTYEKVEAEMLDNIKGTGKITVTEAGPEFFSDINQQWEEIWEERTPVLKDLRKEAQSIN